VIVDTTPAFENGNQGMTIYRTERYFMVSVKTASDGFSIGYGQTPAEALDDALGRRVKPAAPLEDDLFGDLL
jgi:hypothetical protein